MGVRRQMTDTAQTTIDPFREMNRYDDRHEDWPSEAVFEPPRRTLANGWMKFHATRDCGARKVAFVEHTSHRPTDEKWAYSLRCWECGHRIDESEVLFLGGNWYSQHGWRTYGRSLEKLHLPPERVCELGPDPDQDELRHALTLGRIEREGKGILGFSFGRGTWYECDDCGHETPLTYDRKCRMCYDGEWTDQMQDDVAALATAVRERNDSFVHRLPTKLTPTEPAGVASEGEILWRRHDMEPTDKLVEVAQRLEDYDDGHMEYVLWDPTHTNRYRYREEDLNDCFWATGLYNEEPKPVMDDRVREVYQRICDHSYHEVHDRETHEVAAEQCIHCRKRRPLNGEGGGGDAE